MTNLSPLPKLPLTIAVTGHRNLDAACLDSVESQFRDWLLSLTKSYPKTPLRLLSGLAEGADRIAARIFCETRDGLKVQGINEADQWELVAILPMVEEAYRQDFPDSIQEFEDLKARAAAVIALPSPTTEALQSHPELRDGCYEALGRHLVRHCNILAALWDGQHVELRGGTSHVVRMKLQGYADAASSFSIAMHDCGPVWYLPVARVSSTATSQVVLDQSASSIAAWMYPATTGFTEDSFLKAWRAIDEFNGKSDLLIKSEDVHRAALWLSPSEEAHGQLMSLVGPLDRLMIGVQAKADMVAMSVEKKRQRLLRWLYVGGALLATCLWTGLDGVLQLWMAAAYVVLVIILLAGFRRIGQTDLSEDPLSYRFLAEALRVQLYWTIAHETEKFSENSRGSDRSANWEVLRVLDSLLSQQAQEIGWVREALRIGALNPNASQALPEELKRGYMEHWINDQLKYFVRSGKRHEKRSEVIEKCSMVLATLAIIAAIGVLIVDVFHIGSHDIRHAFAIAAAVFPAIALLLQSYSDKMALDEQQKNAVRMQAVFGRAKTGMEQAGLNAHRSAHIIRAIGQEALTECAYWLVLRKSKPPKMPT